MVPSPSPLDTHPPTVHHTPSGAFASAWALRGARLRADLLPKPTPAAPTRLMRRVTAWACEHRGNRYLRWVIFVGGSSAGYELGQRCLDNSDGEKLSVARSMLTRVQPDQVAKLSRMRVSGGFVVCSGPGGASRERAGAGGAGLARAVGGKTLVLDMVP